jgi:hypothetical protein
VRNLALCPNCKIEVSGEDIIREKIDDGETARVSLTSMKDMDVHTTMYSCPNCHIILGISQHTGFSTTARKREVSFL